MSVENNTDFSNGSDDTTIVKIRLPNGQIVQLTVTASSTIQEIKQYIKKYPFYMYLLYMNMCVGKRVHTFICVHTFT